MRFLASSIVLALSCLAVTPTLAVPAAMTTAIQLDAVNSTSVVQPRTNLGPCDNYRPMSLGRLIFHNRAAIVGAMCVRYADDRYSVPWRIPGSGNNDWPRVLAGANHRYDYNDQMSVIDRDRMFNLFVCDLVGTDHAWGHVAGNFQIFSSGPLWTAEVTFDSDDYTSDGQTGYLTPLCTVTDQIR